MSAPVLIACLAAALALGAPAAAIADALAAEHRAAAAADGAALAAADAANGFAFGEPCALAAELADAMHTELISCELIANGRDVRVVVQAVSAFGTRKGLARAAIPNPPARDRTQPRDGWVWPADSPGITQQFHEGLALDLAVTPAGALYSPADGVVVRAGPDGGEIPAPCIAHPEWWRGANSTVIIRHDLPDGVVYSSHNHIEAGSPARYGITVGSRVTAGQQVANAGMSGCTSGPHTHFLMSTKPENTLANVNPFDFIGGARHNAE